MLIALNKPYGVLCQFTSAGGRPTLADHVAQTGVYPAGRLDLDSEGLVLLTDDGRLQAAIAAPAARLVKRYWVEVEGDPSAATLERFCEGLAIGEGAGRYRARPAVARRIATPDVPARVPPVRVRAKIPTSWIEVAIGEGRNRQVRRMTAAIGHPTLRLVRVAIGELALADLALAPGMWTTVEADRLGPAYARHAPTTASATSGKRPLGDGPLSTGTRSRRYWE